VSEIKALAADPRIDADGLKRIHEAKKVFPKSTIKEG
jgi:hypothetical protein